MEQIQLEELSPILFKRFTTNVMDTCTSVPVSPFVFGFYCSQKTVLI